MPQTNGIDLVGPDTRPIAGRLELGDPELVRIDRIRYVGDAWGGPFDLSYAHGTDAAGNKVRVGGLPYQVLGGRNVRRALFGAATQAGVGLNRLCGGHVDDVPSLCW
jgi:hypothetical protein